MELHVNSVVTKLSIPSKVSGKNVMMVILYLMMDVLLHVNKKSDGFVQFQVCHVDVVMVIGIMLTNVLNVMMLVTDVLQEQIKTVTNVLKLLVISNMCLLESVLYKYVVTMKTSVTLT